MKRFLLVTFGFVIYCFPVKAKFECDTSEVKVEEGNIGQPGKLPWLGVLRVYLHDGDRSEVALSGLVLVRPKYALVNADDVVKIPEKVFSEDTTAMFIVNPEDPWFYPLRKYIIHPDYEEKTINTIALVQLDDDREENSIIPSSIRKLTSTLCPDPLPIPVCWPRRRLIPAQDFYLAGYTDDNYILEKVIHKIRFKNKLSCAEYYQKAELDDEKRKPVHFQCGVAATSKSSCVWENGMVLVSNETSFFTLLGLSIRGPGCAAPARFINLQQYHQWVDKTIRTNFEADDKEDIDDGPEEIPLHELFNMNDTRRQRSRLKPHTMFHTSYPFDTSKPRYFNVDERDDKTLAVYAFNDTFEAFTKACSVHKHLLYKEEMELKSVFGQSGTAYYKISLYDLTRNNCSCVVVRVESAWRTPATLAYKEFLEVGEGLAITSSEETPYLLVRPFPTQDREREYKPEEANIWKPHKILKVHFLDFSRRTRKVLNYDLYVRFGFYSSAKLHVEMFGESKMIGTTIKPKRRMFAGLTSEEEKLQFVRQQRRKLTKPPGRKKWYDEENTGRQIRSGLVQDVPPIVKKSFDESDDGTHSNTAADQSSETESANFIKEAVKSFRRPETQNIPQTILKSVSKSDEYKVETTSNRTEATVNDVKPTPAAYKMYKTPNQGTPKSVCGIYILVITALSINIVVQNIIILVI